MNIELKKLITFETAFTSVPKTLRFPYLPWEKKIYVIKDGELSSLIPIDAVYTPHKLDWQIRCKTVSGEMKFFDYERFPIWFYDADEYINYLQTHSYKREMYKKYSQSVSECISRHFDLKTTESYCWNGNVRFLGVTFTAFVGELDDYSKPVTKPVSLPIKHLTVGTCGIEAATDWISSEGSRCFRTRAGALEYVKTHFMPKTPTRISIDITANTAEEAIATATALINLKFKLNI